MEAASYSGVLRMKATQENQELKRRYIESQAYDSLSTMLSAKLVENEEIPNTGLNLAVGYFEAKTNNLRSILEDFKVYSVTQLNEVQSKDKLESSLQSFFREDTSNLFIISLNPLVDKQRRVDLTFSVINKVRLKEGREDVKKYICVLIRIEKEALYELNYCEGWRFVMLETLASHLEMTNK